MFRKSLIPIVVATALAGCGGDDNAEIDGNSRGSLVIVGDQFVAGATLSVQVTDADGIDQSTISYGWSTGATGTSYTITEADEGTVIEASAVYTDEAGFTEGVGASTPIINPTLDLFASVVKGPVAGASCELYPVDENGAVSGAVDETAVSDDAGALSFTNVNFEGNGLVSCTGGTYIDESTGLVLDAPLLRAVIDVVEGTLEDAAPLYVVSPLTEMAVIASAGDLNDFDAQADIINGRFGIRFDTTQVAPTAVGVTALGAEGSENADRYGSVLALLSQLDADNADSDMAAILADLAADIADGEYSEANLAAFETAQINLETTSAVAGVVDVDLLNVIGSAVGYNNDPVAAIIEGALSGTVQNTASEPLEAMATVVDPNFEEDAFVPQTDVSLDYGTFSITAEGAWSYTVNVSNDTVAGLALGESVNDSVTITTVDGTTAEIAIRVASLTQVVEITDPGNDTGEIRFVVPDLRQGKLSASFAKEEALGSDGNIKDAYITLYGTSGSSAESLIDLRIQGTQTNADGTFIDPRFFVRNTDSDAYPGDLVTAPFVESQFYDVEITWDLDQAEQLTVTIDGEIIGGGAFSTAAVVDSDFTDLNQWFAEGVKVVQFRFGDNDRTIPFGSYFVDNIAVYSDVEGTTEVFADDFESYEVGNSLDAADSLYSLAIYAEVNVFDIGDGTSEPTPAVFFDLGGALASDSTEALTGQVSVLDPDEGEAFIIAGTITGAYGVLTIDENGAWSYVLDTANPVIAALITGERESDTLTIQSVDGTTAELVITITGVGGDTGGANNVAVIIDTNDGDTGELRYALGDNGPLLAGSVSAKIKRLDDDLGNADAFITIFNENTNNAGAILDLRIRDNSFGVRSPDVDASAATVILDQFMDVLITWEYPNGDATLNPLVTVSVDGVRFTAEGFTPENDSFGGATHVSFRFGSNSGVAEATGKFTVDDLAIYSDTTATTEVFSDDFESYAAGDSLDTDNAASPYNSSTSEATVETEGEVGGPGTEGNKIAEIRDTDSGDTGELRYALGDNGPLAQGRFEVAVKRLDDELGSGDAFITLFNSATNNAGALLDLRVRDDSFGIRSPGDIDVSAGIVKLDEFMNVVVTWEYPEGNLEALPLINVEVDGLPLLDGGWTPDNDSFGGLTHVSIRFGSNSGTTPDTAIVSVDNIAVYSDVDGTTEIFSDDFEAYVEGDSLDTDNAVSPYNSSTSEAIVAVEQ